MECPKGSNADEWCLFLDEYGTAKEYIAVQIAEAIEAAEQRGLEAAARWRAMGSAPRIATEVLLKTRDDKGHEHLYVAHFAQDLSGEEQPPFGPGWFYSNGYQYSPVRGEPVAWRLLSEKAIRNLGESDEQG